VSDHPHGFEWCINAPAIDAQGTVYANGEDGVLYAIPQGGGKAQAIFLRQSIGAAYTPLSIDARGRVYAENFGSLYVVGE
jgi:outer membrane protein assembly factor BamB